MSLLSFLFIPTHSSKATPIITREWGYQTSIHREGLGAWWRSQRCHLHRLTRSRHYISSATIPSSSLSFTACPFGKSSFPCLVFDVWEASSAGLVRIASRPHQTRCAFLRPDRRPQICINLLSNNYFWFRVIKPCHGTRKRNSMPWDACHLAVTQPWPWQSWDAFGTHSLQVSSSTCHFY